MFKFWDKIKNIKNKPTKPKENIGIFSLRESSPNSVRKLKLVIPEPTNLLIFVTDESPELRINPMSYEIRVTICLDGVKMKDNEEEKKALFAEPSLIWTQLPIQENDELESQPMYYPSYFKLNPKQRYQYINWLTDITKETNLSYVFLYFYGLERQLILGNYEMATNEIARLIKFHNKGTFSCYAIPSLIVASLHKKRFDILEKMPFVYEQPMNASLYLCFLSKRKVTPNQLISLAHNVGYKNNRYIKSAPKMFEIILASKIEEYEKKFGNIWDNINAEEMEIEEETYFANLSIPKNLRTIKTPQILKNETFKSIILKLLTDTHNEIRDNRLNKKVT